LRGGKCAVRVELTLLYRYQANAMFGMYPREYVRERTYRTTVFPRNWWSDSNTWRISNIDSLVGGS